MAGGVIVLCEAMLGEFAMMGGRVMVESLLSAHWMSLRPAERAERFERFSGVELVDFADLLVEQGHLEQSDFDLPYIFDPEYRATLRKEFRSSRLGWTQMRWHELVRDVATSWKEGTAGAEAAEELRSCAAVAQVVSSSHAHVGPTVTMGQLRWGESREAPEDIAFGPTEAARRLWVPEALRLATWAYIQLADHVIERVRFAPRDDWRRLVTSAGARAFVNVTPAGVAGVATTAPCPCESGAVFGECHATSLVEPEDAPSFLTRRWVTRPSEPPP
jgi:hypothetical protein